MKFLSKLIYIKNNMKWDHVIIIDIGKKYQNSVIVERYYYDDEDSESITKDIANATIFKNNNEASIKANELYISLNKNKYSDINVTILTVPKTIEETKIKKNIQTNVGEELIAQIKTMTLRY